MHKKYNIHQFLQDNKYLWISWVKYMEKKFNSQNLIGNSEDCYFSYTDFEAIAFEAAHFTFQNYRRGEGAKLTTLFLQNFKVRTYEYIRPHLNHFPLQEWLPFQEADDGHEKKLKLLDDKARKILSFLLAFQKGKYKDKARVFGVFYFQAGLDYKETSKLTGFQVTRIRQIIKNEIPALIKTFNFAFKYYRSVKNA